MTTVTITLTDEDNTVLTNVHYGTPGGIPDEADASPAQILGMMINKHLTSLAALAADVEEPTDEPS